MAKKRKENQRNIFTLKHDKPILRILLKIINILIPLVINDDYFI